MLALIPEASIENAEKYSAKNSGKKISRFADVEPEEDTALQFELTARAIHNISLSEGDKFPLLAQVWKLFKKEGLDISTDGNVYNQIIEFLNHNDSSSMDKTLDKITTLVKQKAGKKAKKVSRKAVNTK